jgi:photosystem II stability/assembly factor-like uncharacterized protein
MKIKLLFLLVLLSPIMFGQNLWQKLNGPPGGFMVQILAKGDSIIATGENFKIFLSTNQGENWEQFQFPTQGNATILRIWGLEALREYIYAITRYIGIYRSKDLMVWEKLNYSTTCETICKDYSGNIYAGSEDGRLYRSSDEGQSWILEFSDVTRYPFWKILVSSDSSVWAGTRDRLLRKRKNSTVWEESVFPSYDIHSITEDDLSFIYISSYSYVKRSTDDGRTWEDMDPNGFLRNNLMRDFIYNTRIIGAFNDETGFFGNGWGAAVSDDRGINWKWAQTGLPPKISSSRITAEGKDTYIATWGAGVFRSTDFGDSWFGVNNGLNASYVTDMIFDENGDIFTSSWSNGIHHSTDKGKTWKTINNGLTNVYMYSIISDNDGVLFAGSDQGLFRSTDKGENWELTNSFGNNYAYRLHRDNKNRLYAVTYGTGIHRTTDKGLSWSKIDNNFASQYVFGFAIDSSGSIYAGTRGGYIYKTTNDGLLWIMVRSTTNTSSTIVRIEIAENGYIFATTNREGVLRSTDSGLSWTQVNTGLTSMNTGPLTIRENQEIYITDIDLKMYKSTDYGENWINIPAVEKVAVRKILFNEGEMYIPTDESVWKSNPDSLTNIAEDDVKPKDYFLSQNYPNPFNPSTTIKYSLPQTGRVTLSIYDLLGREVVKILDEEKPAGEYETNWNASYYPSGVYFLRMQAGEFSETRKVVLVK